MFCARGGMEVLRALPPVSHGNLATPYLFYGVFEKQASLPKEFFQGKESVRANWSVAKAPSDCYLTLRYLHL